MWAKSIFLDCIYGFKSSIVGYVCLFVIMDKPIITYASNVMKFTFISICNNLDRTAAMEPILNLTSLHINLKVDAMSLLRIKI